MSTQNEQGNGAYEVTAQRYREPVAQDRMAAGLCPECGGKADAHAPFREFWLRPPGCDLLPRGVQDRINQYQRDLSPDRDPEAGR